MLCCQELESKLENAGLLTTSCALVEVPVDMFVNTPSPASRVLLRATTVEAASAEETFSSLSPMTAASLQLNQVQPEHCAQMCSHCVCCSDL